MAEPTQAEIDAVAKAIEYMHPLTIFSSRDRARIAIQALDKVRGECVPIYKLMAKIDELWGGGVGAGRATRAAQLVWWLGRRVFVDDKTPVVTTDRRKP